MRDDMHQPPPGDAPAIEPVARMLAGGDPSPQLVSNLEVLGIALQSFIATEKVRLKRTDMRKQLEKVRDSATELRSTLFDPYVLAFIERGAEHFMRNHSTLWTALADVAQRAKKAVQDYPTGGGQSRAHVGADVPTAHTFCALVIAEAWLLLRDRELAVRNPEAQEIAHSFWVACGGKERKSGHTNTGWRRHFEAEKEIAEVHRRWVRSQLRHSMIGTESDLSDADCGQ